MQRTSADLAKFVGLALFTLSKPEFTPFLCSFFPQVRRLSVGWLVGWWEDTCTRIASQ